MLAATKLPDGELTGATGQVQVSDRGAPTRSRRVGDKAPKVHTDTLETAKGDVAKIDTREPPSDMHEVDFADVVGKKPVALLFATPQLCAVARVRPGHRHRAADASPSTATRWSSSTRRSTSTTT